MSPIIYTRHRCTPSEDPEISEMNKEDLEGTIWQCPECGAYWEALLSRNHHGDILSLQWSCHVRPREEATLRKIGNDLNGTTAALNITPDMVSRNA